MRLLHIVSIEEPPLAMTRESVQAEMKTHSSQNFFLKKEYALQCKGHLLDPWSVKIPHAMEQLLNPHAAMTKALEPRACDP